MHFNLFFVGMEPFGAFRLLTEPHYLKWTLDSVD